MKNFFILFLVALSTSCAALMNPQEQPVYLIDNKETIYGTTCSGLAETIGTCYHKAQKTCEKGYTLIQEKLDSSGVHRAIRFQCK